MFGDVHEYDTMIHSLYEIRQKEGKSMEEYMLQIHEAIAVIRCTYPDRVMDQGKNLAWDRFYHGLAPSLQDALEFAMAELPEREQVSASFDTLYTLAKKEEVHQPMCTCRGSKGLLIPIKRSRGDTPLPGGGWQPSLRKICSHLTLNLWILGCLSWISLRASL